MSKICCTFAPEFGTRIENYDSSGKTDGATLGSDLEGITGRKNILPAGRRKAWSLTEFGLHAFRLPLKI